VLYELCSGKTLFDRESDLARLGAVLTQRIAPLTEVRPDADGAITEALGKALELDPRKRPASAAVFGTLLHGVSMRSGRFVSPSLVADWLEQQLPEELRALGRHPTPRPANVAIAAEPTQRQPSPFSTTIAAPSYTSTPPVSPAPSSISPVSSMVTSLALPQFPGNFSSILNEIGEQVRGVTPLVPMVQDLSQQMQGVVPVVNDLSAQVRLMRRLYWPLVTLFWLFGLGLILLGVFMVMQAGRR
jgi:hypothetical protein